jgi:hypothetical protein
VLYNCRPKVMRNAKPTFINSNSCLHIALRRAPRRRAVWCSGLTAALNLFLRCAFHHSTKFESANKLSLREPLFSQECAYILTGLRQIPPGLLTLPSGEGFVLHIVWTLLCT